MAGYYYRQLDREKRGVYDAMLAGIGIGALTPQDIKRVVKIKYVTEPAPEKAALYQPMKKHFAELYRRNADIMHAL